MRQQYGLRVQSQEFAEMGWQEFSDLVAGLNESTPLVRVAEIRTETDRERIHAMTPEQRRMRSEWQRERARRVPASDRDEFVATLQRAFAQAFSDGR